MRNLYRLLAGVLMTVVIMGTPYGMETAKVLGMLYSLTLFQTYSGRSVGKYLDTL